MEVNALKQAAHAYFNRGFSVIPIRAKSKKPLIKWESFQKVKADQSQIEQWWAKTPKANIGIVTGEISGLAVIDVDPEGKAKLNELLPGDFQTPTAKSPRGGWHLYCQYQAGLRNLTGVPEGCDLRAEGGI